MSQLWGYSDLYNLIDERPNLKLGMMIDTNLLVAATYDFDENNEKTKEFLELIFENEIPLYCNVNVKAEFLEIHRRIIFTEAIIDFAQAIDIVKLPPSLASKITSLKTRVMKLEKRNKEEKIDPPKVLRLSEAEIKDFKLEIVRVSNSAGENLWYELCESRVGDKISTLWEDSKDEYGLNFIGTRQDDQDKHLKFEPDWSNATDLMERQGLSSADAMIVNMFLASKFDVLITSDNEVALAILKNAKDPQGCIVPERVKRAIE
jgi:predicted nucleic acid-binding protein